MPPTPRGSTGFFSTRELLRLSSAIFLLGIVGLLYVQTKKSSSWKTIASDKAAAEAAAKPVVPLGTPWKELVFQPPSRENKAENYALHTDEEEIDALQEELQAIGDMTPLAAEEMPAYWRMVKWAYSKPGEDLRKLARTDLQFTHLFQAPSKHRGALVDVKLHVRLMRQHDAPENSAQVTRVYEAWGPSEESQTFPYCVVFVDVPPGIEVKGAAFLDARFVGFFLKKMSYEDAMGVKRTAPLLIGRMLYDEAAALQNKPDEGLNVRWIMGIVVSLVGLVLLVQWWARMKPPTQRMPMIDEATVDSFLEDIEAGHPPSPPQNPSDSRRTD